MSSTVPVGALLTAALLSAPPDTDGLQRSVKVTSGRLAECPTESEPERRCLTLRVHVTTPMDGQESRETVPFVADEQLVERVYDTFGQSAPDVFDAMVPTLGRVLKLPGRLRNKAALLGLDVLDSAEVLRYYTMKEGVTLSAAIEARLARIAARYFRATGSTLLITSGTRDPESQADAMYGKLAHGANLLRLYGQKAAIRAIVAAYRQGRQEKRSREEIVADMAAVIQEQCDRDVYISKHVVAGAVDVRSYNMSRRQKFAFRQAVKAEPGVSVLQERRPPHFHLSFD